MALTVRAALAALAIALPARARGDATVPGRDAGAAAQTPGNESTRGWFKACDQILTGLTGELAKLDSRAGPLRPVNRITKSGVPDVFIVDAKDDPYLQILVEVEGRPRTVARWAESFFRGGSNLDCFVGSRKQGVISFCGLRGGARAIATSIESAVDRCISAIRSASP